MLSERHDAVKRLPNPADKVRDLDGHVQRLITDILRVGPAGILTGIEVAAQLGVRPTQVQGIVGHARESGYPVASKYGQGYWLPDDWQQVQATIDMMQKQINALKMHIEDLQEGWAAGPPWLADA